jgi:hypothetical protein
VILSGFFAALQISASTAAIAGTVRDDTAEQVLAGVQITEGGLLSATTDSLGHYTISGLAAGAHQLRFSYPGYTPLELRVVLADSSSSTTVDVQLAAVPVHLPTLQTVATSATDSAVGENAELGRLSLREDWLDRRPVGEGDADRALADAAGVEGAGEGSPGIHVRGGATSDNLVLLDGIPLLSAMHYSGSSSAVAPEAIGAAQLHTGVSSARFGDHLAGVVELETREPGSAPLEARGSLAPENVRQVLRSYLPGLRTGILLGARTTYRSALAGESSGESPNGYQDLLGVSTTQIGGGRLRFVSFLSGNRLAFPSSGDRAQGGTETGDAHPDEGDAAGVPRNLLSWNGHSQGVNWQRTSASGTRLETSAWWAGSSADVRWLSSTGPDQVQSRLSQIGLSGLVTWPSATGSSSAGVSLVRSSTRYTVTPLGGTFSAADPSLSLSAAPAIGSVFAEQVWRPAPPLLLSAGLRVSTDFGDWTGLEPRVSAMLRLDNNTRVGVGMGRSHQVVQSAANDASALGDLIGLDLPVAAHAGTLPVAAADQVETFVGRRLAQGLELAFTGYARRSSGVLLGAVSARGLFPADSIVVGQGYASGITGELDLERGPVWGYAGITLGRDVRRAGSTAYDASYGQGGALSLELGYRFHQDTRLLLRFRASARAPTTIVSSGFEWQPLQSLGDPGELSGTPENLPGPINGARLPGYARLDLGIRRSWRIPGLGSTALLTTGISVTNLQDRENVLALVGRADGSVGIVRAAPRSLALEVGWQF